MKNIFFAKFESNQRSCEVYGLWQYDYGQVLRIQGLRLPPAVEIHFSLTEKGGTSVTRVGTTKDGVTDVVIPDSLLENDDASQDYWIYAYIYMTDETSGSTEYKIAMKVKSRPRPEAIDRPEDQELFREAIAAVNEAAERAENAVNNLNADVSEKVTRPDTAEVGQALVVKEIDETGKPTVFEAEDIKVPTKTSELENDSGYLTEHQDISGKLDAVKLPEAIDTALAEAKESGAFDGKDGADGAPGEKGEKGEPGETTYIENPYDDTELKSEIATKITAPENPAVGKVFKIKSVNEDGTFVGEWADGGVANLDVQIAGKSIVQDGVAEIPVSAGEKYGVARYSNTLGVMLNTGGYVVLSNATQYAIDKRVNYTNQFGAITSSNVDYAVKAAMCDGKGAAWTAEEQAAGRERMGIDEWEPILDITLEEESSFSADFEHEYKKLYIYIDQSGVSEKICSPMYCLPYSAVSADNKKINSFNSYYAATTNAFFNISAYWESYGSITKRIMNTINNQTETIGNAYAYIKSWDTSVCDKAGIGKPFKGIYPSVTIFKPGTRIVIKGVRA